MKIYTITLLLTLTVISNIYTQNFWEKTAGPDTTTIWSLAINSSGHIFAGNGSNGVYRSTNNGISWLNIGPNLGPYSYKIPSIVVSQNGDILVGIDDEFANGGIYHSTNNGNTWSVFGIPEHPVTSIAVSSNGNIFTGTSAVGIYRSTDNGANWDPINQGLTSQNINSLIINTSGDVFAGTMFGGVFRSTNNGANWDPINTGLTDYNVTSFTINTSGDIFAGTANNGIFRSTDNGENWIQVNTGLTMGQGYRVRSFAINSNGNIFSGTADGIFRSTDNGDNWVQINQGLTNIYIHSLAINSNGNIFAGTEDGVFRSSNSTLPVELTFFSSTVNNNKVQLNWQTATEVNNYGFDVERCALSAEPQAWEKIGFVHGNGNSNSPKEYSYEDMNPIGGSRFNYRLKQIDNDGQFDYSEVLEIENVPTEFKLFQNYPNPFNPDTKISWQSPVGSHQLLKIYDLLGNEVATIVDEYRDAGNYEINFDASRLASGVYFYRLQSGSFIESKKMTLLR